MSILFVLRLDSILSKIDLLLNLAKVLNPPPNLFDNPPANITNIILFL